MFECTTWELSYKVLWSGDLISSNTTTLIFTIILTLVMFECTTWELSCSILTCGLWCNAIGMPTNNLVVVLPLLIQVESHHLHQIQMIRYYIFCLMPLLHSILTLINVRNINLHMLSHVRMCNLHINLMFRFIWTLLTWEYVYIENWCSLTNAQSVSWQ